MRKLILGVAPLLFRLGDSGLCRSSLRLELLRLQGEVRGGGRGEGCKQGRGEGAWGEVRCNLHLLYIRRACCCAAASTAAARCTARSAALVAP